MNVAITILNSAAGALLLHITTTFMKKSHSPETGPEPKTEPEDKAKAFQQQAATLWQEFEAVESRHKYFVEKILPLLPLTDKSDMDVVDVHSGAKKVKWLLQKHACSLIDLKTRISCEGTYLVQDEFETLAGDLKNLEKEFMTRTTAAKKILRMVVDNPEARHALYGKDNEKDESEINPTITSEDSPLPSSNADTDRFEIRVTIAENRSDLGVGVLEV